MMIIDTPFHITFVEYSGEPILACVGNCKKAWWSEDFEKRDQSVCPMCGSKVQPAFNNVHYKILNKANRELKFSDFKKVVAMSHKEKLKIKHFLQSGIKISNLSLVKPTFEEKARKEWC